MTPLQVPVGPVGVATVKLKLQQEVFTVFSTALYEQKKKKKKWQTIVLRILLWMDHHYIDNRGIPKILKPPFFWNQVSKFSSFLFPMSSC